jgi:DNA sulfur modification protein DndB
MKPTTAKLAESYSYVFSALRGVQAGREYYTAMCPLKLVSKIFLFDEDELPPTLRAQRAINRARIPEISRYLVENPKEYVFSSITASIDGSVRFEPFDPEHSFIGRLSVPMTARFIINDGQHRRAGIEEALKHRPELGDETISVVFFLDEGLQRSQQMFADLNKHAIRPTKSLGILYDLRDPVSQAVRKLIQEVPIFRGLTETEKTTISNRSIKLFTLSSIFQGTQALLNKKPKDRMTRDEEALAHDFWVEITDQISEWGLILDKQVHAAELRKDFIHAHGLALHALGIMGHTLVTTEPDKWRNRLRMLKKVDWSRSNTATWEGRATIGGRVSKAHSNVILTAAFLKKSLELPLSPEESKLDNSRRKAGRTW